MESKKRPARSSKAIPPKPERKAIAPKQDGKPRVRKPAGPAPPPAATQVPVASPSSGGTEPRPFDPATGEWLPVANDAPWNPEAPRKGTRALVWNIILGIDLGLLGLFLVAAVLLYFFPIGGTLKVDAWALVANSVVNLVLMGLIPFLWVVNTRVGGLHGAMHYLRLERPGRAIPQGILLGLGLWLALIVVLAAVMKAGVKLENPQADALMASMTIPLALLVSLAAGVGEEILFRGVLQRWIGVWPQAILFGLLHADYGVPAQILVPFGLGLLFGYLVKRGARLWVPIAAHFTFDFVQLALAAVAKDLPGT